MSNQITYYTVSPPLKSSILRGWWHARPLFNQLVKDGYVINDLKSRKGDIDFLNPNQSSNDVTHALFIDNVALDELRATRQIREDVSELCDLMESGVPTVIYDIDGILSDGEFFSKDTKVGQCLLRPFLEQYQNRHGNVTIIYPFYNLDAYGESMKCYNPTHIPFTYDTSEWIVWSHLESSSRYFFHYIGNYFKRQSLKKYVKNCNKLVKLTGADWYKNGDKPDNVEWESPRAYTSEELHESAMNTEVSLFTYPQPNPLKIVPLRIVDYLKYVGKPIVVDTEDGNFLNLTPVDHQLAKLPSGAQLQVAIHHNVARHIAKFKSLLQLKEN